jgi:hypothetical protein
VGGYLRVLPLSGMFAEINTIIVLTFLLLSRSRFIQPSVGLQFLPQSLLWVVSVLTLWLLIYSPLQSFIFFGFMVAGEEIESESMLLTEF